MFVNNEMLRIWNFESITILQFILGIWMDISSYLVKIQVSL